MTGQDLMFSQEGPGGFYTFPGGQIRCSTAHRDANLACLLRAPGPINEELAFEDFRTVDGGPHCVEMSWQQGKVAKAIDVHFSPGYEAQNLVVTAIIEGQERALELKDRRPKRLRFKGSDTPLQGLKISQSAGQGSSRHPQSMRLRGLAFHSLIEAKRSLQIQHRDRQLGAVHDLDAPETWPLDLSDGEKIHLKAIECRALRLKIPALGAIPHLKAWIAADLSLEVEQRTLRPANIGVAWAPGSTPSLGGVLWLLIELPMQLSAQNFAITLPKRRSHSLLMSGLDILDGEALLELRNHFDFTQKLPSPPDWSGAVSNPTTAYPTSLRQGGQPAQYALYPDGQLTLPWPGNRHLNLHLAFNLDGCALYSYSLTRSWQENRLLLSVKGQQHQLEMLFWVHKGQLHGQISCLTGSMPCLGLEIALVHRLITQDLQVKSLEVPNRQGVKPLEHCFLLAAQASQFRLSIRPLNGDKQAHLIPDGTPLCTGKQASPRVKIHSFNLGELAVQQGLKFTLGPEHIPHPDPYFLSPKRAKKPPTQGLLGGLTQPQINLGQPLWQGRFEQLWGRIPNFIGPGYKVHYGTYPSPYDRMIFGLEEDYLFRAIALWGQPDVALKLFGNSYLNERHLDPAHYLADLRHALPPWQLWWLMNLQHQNTYPHMPSHWGQTIVRCGKWLSEQIQVSQKLQAQGAKIEAGLLPPFRYGGDLDFKTQALHSNAMAVVGLKALGLITGNTKWNQQSQHLRAALIRTWKRLHKDGHYPMDTGGGNPGDYEQLMISGMVQWVDFFSDEDPIQQSIERWMQRENRLFLQLPRFNLWGDSNSVDGHYAVGHLLHRLRSGDPAAFLQGLSALFDHAMDPQTMDFAEVSAIRSGAYSGPTLPGRRVFNAAPCVGSLGVALLLLRHCFITELRDSEGWPEARLRLFAAVPPELWAKDLHLPNMPTLAGPLTIVAKGEGHNWRVKVQFCDPDTQRPALKGLEIVDGHGHIHQIPLGESFLLAGKHS